MIKNSAKAESYFSAVYFALIGLLCFYALFFNQGLASFVLAPLFYSAVIFILFLFPLIAFTVLALIEWKKSGWFNSSQ